MASQSKQTVHNGATVLIQLGGATVGRAQGLDSRRSFGTEGVYEVGSIMPQEHVYQRYEGSITLERFLIKRDAEVPSGYIKDLATNESVGLGEDILTKDVLDIIVIDKASGNTIRAYRRCTASEYSENFRVGAISGENATFYYMSSDSGDATQASGTQG